jgi:ADP-heptose:LPS heptosyltransferase
VVPPADVAAWRQANNLGQTFAVALAPGSVGASKRWTYYAEAAKCSPNRARCLGGRRPRRKGHRNEIVNFAGPRVRDLTGTDLRNGIMAMAAAKTVISNDSGLMHIAAAIGTPAIGIFGPPALPLGAAQRPCRHHQASDRPALPAVPQARLHPERPSLHARHSGFTGGGDRAARDGRSR